jgi:hypothetical protein
LWGFLLSNDVPMCPTPRPACKIGTDVLPGVLSVIGPWP